MNTLFALADWLYSLNPYALASVSFLALLFAAGLAAVVAYFVTCARSGAGETNDGETEGRE